MPVHMLDGREIKIDRYGQACQRGHPFGYPNRLAKVVSLVSISNTTANL